ncbi:MAG TPA: chemotaxis protein CheW [Gemmatimonadaceae bacterium]|nr:chemotaxis protein CheW [Gemmatimonadaceae bacterium]
MNTPAESSQVVTFRLGDDLFAADIYSVERVLRYRAPTPIPDVPEWMTGVIDYQGRVVPLLDLRRRFSMPAVAPRGDTRMIVFTVGGEWIATLADAVLDVSTIATASVAPPPPLFRGLAGEYLRGLVRRDDALVLVLDVDRLLSSDERLVLERATDAVAPDA